VPAAAAPTRTSCLVLALNVAAFTAVALGLIGMLLPALPADGAVRGAFAYQPDRSCDAARTSADDWVCHRFQPLNSGMPSHAQEQIENLVGAERDWRD